MDPYYSDDLVTLYHGDCREVTAWLEADVLVMDPPYGRSWRQGEIRGTRRSSAHAGIANDGTTQVRDDALAMWGERPAVVFGDLMLPPPVGTKLVGVYLKPGDAGVRGSIAGVRRDAEAIYFLGPWRSPMGGRSSVFRTAAPTVGNPTGLAARYGHPHAKPLDVLAELIGLTSGRVADPTAGGGSALVIAKQLGRKAIGVEIEERHCETIAKRLSQGVLDFDGDCHCIGMDEIPGCTHGAVQPPTAVYPSGRGVVSSSTLLPYSDNPKPSGRSDAEREAGAIAMRRAFNEAVQRAAEDAPRRANRIGRH